MTRRTRGVLVLAVAIAVVALGVFVGIGSARSGHKGPAARAAATTPTTTTSTSTTPAPAPSAQFAACPTSGGANFIQGKVVSSATGKPEAGVWVIAETYGLPTPYRKIVVTNGKGQFLVPQLPQVISGYKVWVRGYGLDDSAGVASCTTDTPLTLQVDPASSPQDAAAIYPANYWFSMFNVPKPPAGQTREQWAASLKLGCELCHQLGDAATRSIDETPPGTSVPDIAAAYSQAWKQAYTMSQTADGLGRSTLATAIAKWVHKVNAGQTPAPPPRPSGKERDMVISEWQWGDQFSYAHDSISTDPFNPTVNANGPIYGVDLAQDQILEVNPQTNTASAVHIPTRGGFNTPWCDQTYVPLSGGTPQPNGFGTLGCPTADGHSDFQGAYHNPANPHTITMDSDGNVWFTTQIRREWAQDTPKYCQSDPVIINNRHHRQIGMFNPQTGKIELIDSCFGTHHLEFNPVNGLLYFSGDSFVVGWLNPKLYNPNDPNSIQAAEGYAETKVASTATGVADTPLTGFNYGIATDPVDGTVWTAQPSTPGRILRFDPKTGQFEAYSPPFPGEGTRGIGVDNKGHVWVGLAGSGDIAEFDRSKCPHTWGTGDQCPQGWTIYPVPGPDLGGMSDVKADFQYQLFVDRDNTLGLGKNLPILTGTGSDSLLVFHPNTKRWTVIRIPYPLDSYMRLVDGRIDDASGGWNGRGLWYDLGLDPLSHSELGRSYVGHVQFRPNPLAK